ncbi:SDR family NAD(P)-dependent oxidoreductase [Neobacillus terrae]|uniref:SDR family NAD(P)-dependent oxidoreductase n=1 Tax=Neobacillus terrae TaxID=3034837 RepID=UPI0014080B3E|nr:SDR family NAD(P)-dependent oxidoreductase [Neobacillus terrae]NHM32467.1 SDR family oxidoreductase [Neobacillus terrae]
MTESKGLAVVTGAGSGIGKAIALRLAKDGFLVGVTDVDEQAINKVVTEIRENQGDARGVYLDVTDKESIISALEQLVNQAGNLKVWVSNAGVSSMNHFVDLSEKDWDFNMNINAKGAFLCGQVAAQRFISQNEGGKIINTASMAGKQGNVPFLSHYVASKFAVVGLTQSMAHELGKYKITVNSVCPGFVSTPMQERELEWEGRLKNQSDEEVKQGMIAVTPLGRLESPKDVAKVVSFLAGPDSDFITGEAIAVNGGAYMD